MNQSLLENISNQKYFLFETFKTVLNMIINRGYMIPEEEMDILSEDYTEDDFQEYLIDKIKERKAKKLIDVLSDVFFSEEGKECYMYFITNDINKKKVSKTAISYFENEIEKNPNVKNIIIISSTEYSAPAKTHLISLNKNFNMDFPKWEFFEMKELLYNPVEFLDTPKHELLSPEEEQKVMAELKISKLKLPYLLPEDKIVKYYGWEPGRVIRIHRNDDMFDSLTENTYQYRYIPLIE